MSAVISRLESEQDNAISLLAEAVAIKSVSAKPETRPHVVEMAEWLVKQINVCVPGSKVWLEKNAAGEETFSDGKKAEYPPLVFAELGKFSPEKKTVLIYAHYDVQPAEMSDGWDTDPWVLTRMAGEMRGRGSTDDKGPLVGWLYVFKMYSECGVQIPVNVKLVLEGMEESGSIGFDETVEAHKAKNPDWWTSCDWCIVSDNYWLGTEKPCLSYGLRGLTGCEVTISGPACDLHSGVFSGAVFQPLDDLVYIFANLKDAQGRCMIPGVADEVAPVTEAEREMYAKLTFDVESFRKQVGCEKLRGSAKEEILMARWRDPALSIHGIEGAYSEAGMKTVIPRKVIGKFSLRTVPNQTAEHVEKCIEDYLQSLMNGRRARGETANKMSIALDSGPWFYVDPLASDVFKAAHRAIQDVWGVEPDYTREGGSIPVTVTLSRLTGKELCLLPMGRADDGAHSQNEKLDVNNFIMGMKVFARFLEALPKQ